MGERAGPAPGVDVVDVSQTSISLKWSRPRDSMSPICSYQILMQTGGTGGNLSLPRVEDTASVDTEAVIDGLSPGTWYEFRVAGRNDGGWGALSTMTEPTKTLGEATNSSVEVPAGSADKPGEEMSGAVVLWESVGETDFLAKNKRAPME